MYAECHIYPILLTTLHMRARESPAPFHDNTDADAMVYKGTLPMKPSKILGHNHNLTLPSSLPLPPNKFIKLLPLLPSADGLVLALPLLPSPSSDSPPPSHFGRLNPPLP